MFLFPEWKMFWQADLKNSDLKQTSHRFIVDWNATDFVPKSLAIFPVPLFHVC